MAIKKNPIAGKKYEEKFGTFLYDNARTAGNLISKLKYRFKITQSDINKWLGKPNPKTAVQDFVCKYELALDIRRDFYFEQVKAFKMDKQVFATMMWSEFRESVTPPREQNNNNKTDVNMSLDDKTLQHMMESIKTADNSQGFQ